MWQHLVFRGCSEPAKRAIRVSWRKKVDRFDRLLERIPESARHLRVVVAALPDHKTYDVRGVLLLPGGTLVAAASAQGHDAALDGAADRLAEELRRHKDRLQHETLRRKRGARRRAPAVSDHLQRF